MEYKIAPSLMCMDLLNIEQQIKILNKYSYAYHVDIIDGVYFKNFSFTFPFVKAIRGITNKIIDSHLMLDDPIYYIDEALGCGSDYITLHSEKVVNDIYRVSEKIHGKGKKLGIVLAPSVSVDSILEYIEVVDKITILTMDPGYSGGVFVPKTVDKIAKLDKLRKENNFKYMIDFDGAPYKETFPLYKKAGVDIYTLGSRGLFNLDSDLDIACQKAIENIKNA